MKRQKGLFIWCKLCQKVTKHDDSGCLKCGAQRPRPDKRVPNPFPRGRGF